MHIRLELHSGDPIYRQIADQIKLLVASGSVRPGDRLPAVRQLAAQLKINPNTVARAYAMLIDEGVIGGQHGRGTFVLHPPTTARQRKLRREQVEKIIDEAVAEALRLGISMAEVEAAWAEKITHWKESE